MGALDSLLSKQPTSNRSSGSALDLLIQKGTKKPTPVKKVSQPTTVKKPSVNINQAVKSGGLTVNKPPERKTMLQQIAGANTDGVKKALFKMAEESFKAAIRTKNPVLSMVSDKNVQKFGEEAGKFLQKTPDTTIKIQPKKKTDAKWVGGRQQIGPVSVPVSEVGSKAIPFFSSMVGDSVRSYGKSLERISSPKGRGDIISGVKTAATETIPRIAKDPTNLKNYGDLIGNPAVQTGLDASDFIPGLGIGSISIKNLFKKGSKEIIETVTERGLTRSIGKIPIRKEYEPAVQILKKTLAKRDVHLIDEFTEWVGKTGGNSMKAYEQIDPQVLENMVLMTKAVFGQKAVDSWSYKKMADAWGYSFRRLVEGKNVPIGLEINDVSENFARKGDGGLAQNLQEKTQQQSLSDTSQKTTQAITRQTGQVRPASSSVPSNPSSGSIIADDGKFPQKPQELNVNRLDLTPEQKANVVSLEGKDVRQKLGDRQILKIARDSGLDTKTYDIDQTAKKIAEQLNVRRDIVTLENQLLKTTDASQREQILKKIADQSRISRTQGTDIARQLSARRIIANELDTPMQRVFKLLDNAGVNPDVYIKKAKDVNFSDPKAVIKFYRELVPAKFHEWVDVVRYNSMLSSPKTQIVNVFGNLLNTSVVAPIEKTLTGVVDLFSSKITGKDQARFAGEGLAYTSGYFRNTKNAINKLVSVMRGRSPITNLDIERAPVATTGFRGALAKTLETPTKLMEAFDQFFMALTEGGEKASLDYIKKRGGKITGDASITAIENAKYRLFRQALGDKSQGALLDTLDYIPKSINAARNSKNPITRTIARFTFPFISTPTNIAKQGVEYSPFGFTTMFGAKNKTEQFTKALIGTLTTAGAATLLASGRLSWAEPTDADEKSAFRAAGQQPYSVKIGDKWISYTNLPPALSFNLALISALDDTIKNGKTDQSTVDKILKSVAKMGNFFADKSYMKQMGDLLAAVKLDPEAVSRYISNYPQQVIPFRALSGWIARMFDDTQRKVDYSQGFINQQVQQLMLNIPTLSQKLNPRIDAQGNPIKQQHRFINAVSPLSLSTEIKEKLIFLEEEKGAVSLYKYLKKMDKDKANEYVSDLAERKSGTYGDIKKFKAIDDIGLGEPEYKMVGSGIKDGKRALMIAARLNQLSSKSKKNDYIERLYELEIMNDDVYEQLRDLKDVGRLKDPTE